MTDLPIFRPGGYRFIPAVFQYSGGVAAEPGFVLERVTFTKPLPLAEGFRRAEAIMRAAGREPTAFAACELRSPAPFTEAGFKAFNEIYVGTLTTWGIFDGKTNPVARSNVCPGIAPPAEPSLYAFSYTRVAGPGDPPSFVVAGSGEAAEGHANYRDHIIRRGDVSPAGMTEKARWVFGEMERRLRLLGFDWTDTTAVQVYSVQDYHGALDGGIAPAPSLNHGLTWHFCRPPIVELEYEMDCRGLPVERTLST
jgi:hypothetical protein